MNHTLMQLFTPDVALLFLRISAASLLFLVHGWPKLRFFDTELMRIEDPFHMGRKPTLLLAILAEVLCPIAIALGWQTRLACVPIIVVLLISLFVVHREWRLEEGQFAWLLLIIFITLSLAGGGAYSLDQSLLPNLT